MSEPVVQVSALTRRFGATTALDSVSLSLARGAVHGLVGANGAGKTTLIRHILGLLRAKEGSVRVFGLDPVAHPVAVLSRLGYLAEDHDLPGWMCIEELLRYSRAFYSTWDDAYAEELRKTFALEPGARIRKLSKGQRARAGLLVALAHRPQLLVLDEPSSGLDPMARRDILAAVLRTLAEEGRTVLFSSHLLEEVEQVADQVTMIHRGRVVLSGPLGTLKASHRRLTVRFAEEKYEPPEIPGVLAWDGGGREWKALVSVDPAGPKAALEARGGRVVADRSPSLQEIFVARAGSVAVPDGNR